MMDQRRENRNAPIPPPHGFSLDYWQIPPYPEKKRQTHNITSANKRWEFPQHSLCQEKLRVSSTLL